MTSPKTIYFDMDGTIANLYGVDGWLDDLINERVRPYHAASVMVNMNVLARTLNKLQRNGYKIGIVSWLSKNGTKEYNREVYYTKIEWLKKHLKSVHFDEVHIVKYGTPKWKVVNDKMGILFDDEEHNRTEWTGTAYDVSNIIETLKAIA